MGWQEPRKEPSGDIEKWEWSLIKELVRQLGSDDPDYLETKLLIKLTDIKTNKGSPRSWKNYLWISLRNYGLNIIQRSFHPKTVLVDPVEAFESDDGTEFIREITPSERTADSYQALALERAFGGILVLGFDVCGGR